MTEDVKVEQICNHLWIVTSWNVSEHSRSAQELMCQKCGCFVNHDGLQFVRVNHQHPVNNTSFHVAQTGELNQSHISE